MKKFLLFFTAVLALCLPLAAETKTETIDFSKQGWTSDSDISGSKVTTDFAVVSFAKNEGTTPPKYYAEVRLYKPSSGKINGNSITITPTDQIKRISSAYIVKSDDAETAFTANQDGSFVFINKTSSYIKVKGLKITYEYEINTDPAGVPVVTVNGVELENGCYYEISKGAKAKVTAENATSITVNSEVVKNGIFEITEEEDYTITSSNEYGSSNINFHIHIIDPKAITTTSYAWTKISSTDELTEDADYLLVANGSYTTKSGTVYEYCHTAKNENNPNNRKSIGVTISNDEITDLPADAFIFHLQKKGDNWNWVATNYISATGTTTTGFLSGKTGTNYLYVIDNADETTETSINFDATTGYALIEFVNVFDSDQNATTTKKIKFNARQKLFAAYHTAESETNQPVQIYKKDGKPKTEYVHSIEEYIELPDCEHNPGNHTVTYSCNHPDVKFEAKYYAAPTAKTYSTKSVLAEGGAWETLENGQLEYGELDHDIIVEARAVRTSKAGKEVKSPIHAMLIRTNGTVTGVEEVAAEAEAEAVLYNLQGVRVDRATAAPGLYIERRGSKTTKVIL